MQILTFLLNEEKFAVDINLVDTIEHKMPITTVPKSKKYVIGLISNRGNVIPVINTSLILNQKEQTNDFKKLIIVNLENYKFALAVNEIDDVVDIEMEDIKKVDENETLSVVKLNSNIITVLTYNELKNI
jgi:purine-binding chemotaxis protein CheW